MPLYRLVLVLPALCMLAGCADNFVPKSEPSFYRNLAQPGAQLDAAAAASMISGYRANNGLPAVELDFDLMRLAQTQAKTFGVPDLPMLRIPHPLGGIDVEQVKNRAAVALPKLIELVKEHGR